MAVSVRRTFASAALKTTPARLPKRPAPRYSAGLKHVRSVGPFRGVVSPTHSVIAASCAMNRAPDRLLHRFDLPRGCATIHCFLASPPQDQDRISVKRLCRTCCSRGQSCRAAKQARVCSSRSPRRRSATAGFAVIVRSAPEQREVATRGDPFDRDQHMALIEPWRSEGQQRGSSRSERPRRPCDSADQVHRRCHAQSDLRDDPQDRADLTFIRYYSTHLGFKAGAGRLV